MGSSWYENQGFVSVVKKLWFSMPFCSGEVESLIFCGGRKEVTYVSYHLHNVSHISKEGLRDIALLLTFCLHDSNLWYWYICRTVSGRQSAIRGLVTC